jgi:hypothetical protein
MCPYLRNLNAQAMNELNYCVDCTDNTIHPAVAQYSNVFCVCIDSLLSPNSIPIPFHFPVFFLFVSLYLSLSLSLSLRSPI